MTISLDDDLSQCTDFDVPAVFATTPTATTINGTMQTGTKKTLLNGMVEVEAQVPSFWARTSLIGFVTTKTNVTIGGISYKVQDIENLGTGMTVIWLRTN